MEMGNYSKHNKTWLKGLIKKLRSKAPILESIGLNQSRRVTGQYSFNTEVKAYESIVFYIQKGLGDYKEIIADIVKEMLNFQGSTSFTHYKVYIFPFGWNNDKLYYTKTPICNITR